MRSIHALALIPLTLLILLTMVVGCSPSTHTRTYEVAVKNELQRPITVWLTKSGSPAEKGWISPEEIAAMVPGYEERFSGVLVPAGKTASTGKVQGEFYPEGIAWLRVYDGKYPELSDLLAVSPGPRRVDKALSPGKNDLVVKEEGGKLRVEGGGARAK